VIVRDRKRLAPIFVRKHVRYAAETPGAGAQTLSGAVSVTVASLENASTIVRVCGLYALNCAV
jgi:hypothetical protein